MLPVVTQGHEASGTIAELGAGVAGWAVGDRVIPSAGKACLRCRNCRRGDLTNCLNIQLMAFAYDGAWAEYTVAQAGGLTRIPDNVPFDQAAILPKDYVQGGTPSRRGVHAVRCRRARWTASLSPAGSSWSG
ncbi:alcohol dehydrogenase GroES-like domain protein [Rhodococcus sp. MTM3W5.2]|nr:alcohol dehydrogenase GroES-like domain protein [Rhodococcus sp. MTM3W5.2]